MISSDYEATMRKDQTTMNGDAAYMGDMNVL